MSHRMRPFTDYQRKLIEQEIPFYIDRHDGQMEEIQLGKNYFTMVFLNAFDNDVRTIVHNAIEECNQYGDFISTEYVITNVRRFTVEEIERELNKQQ